LVENRASSGGSLQTVSRAFSVLRCFEEGAVSLSLAELTDRTALNKVTTFRLAETLVTEGMLIKDKKTGLYSISYGWLSLGRYLLDPAGLVSRAQPIVEAAQKTTGETAIINLREADKAVVMCEIISPKPIRYSLGLGFRIDLRVGAAGWAILSQLPEIEVDEILAAPPAVMAVGGEISAEEIKARLVDIRKQGFATTQSQRMRDAVGYAAPFFGVDGSVICSIAVIIPATRKRGGDQRQQFVDTVRNSANQLSAMLGSAKEVA
jgi:IclR family acetate operon transcriptional repressor